MEIFDLHHLLISLVPLSCQLHHSVEVCVLRHSHRHVVVKVSLRPYPNDIREGNLQIIQLIN